MSEEIRNLPAILPEMPLQNCTKSSLEFRADLHCHSTCSDGSMTPVELVNLAKQNALSALAITDHDNIDAYMLAQEEAKRVGLLLGTGVEFSSYFQGISIHVLGYDFLPQHPEMIALCKKHKQAREERNHRILFKLARMRMPLDEAELRGNTIGRPHIAGLLVQKGYVRTVKEAFALYLGEGKCCYEKGLFSSTAEVVEAIHCAEGKAFIAHPHLIIPKSLFKALCALSFDGLEAYYAKLDAQKAKRWIDVAQKKGWLISGGSDFHGTATPYLTLGSSWLSAPHFYNIYPAD